MDLALLQAQLEERLERIESVLGPNYTLALVCKAKPGCGDADILLTLLSREDILKVVDRFLPA